MNYLRLVPRENLTFLGAEDVVEAVAGGEAGEGKVGGGGRVVMTKLKSKERGTTGARLWILRRLFCSS